MTPPEWDRLVTPRGTGLFRNRYSEIRSRLALHVVRQGEQVRESVIDAKQRGIDLSAAGSRLSRAVTDLRPKAVELPARLSESAHAFAKLDGMRLGLDQAKPPVDDSGRQ